MVDEANRMVKDSDERMAMDSKRREQNLVMINDMNTGNHISETESKFSFSLNDEKAASEKDVRDFVSSMTNSSYVDSSESSSVVEFSQPSEKLVPYMDKNVLECELKESTFCCRENTCQDVKDICVDEGVPTRDQTLWEDTVDKNKSCTFLLPEMDPKKGITRDEVKSNAVVLYALDLSSQEDSGKCAANQYHSENLVQMVATDMIVDDEGKQMVMTKSKAMQELNGEDYRSSVDEGGKNAKICSEPTSACTSKESKCNCAETIFEPQTLPSIADGSNSESVASDSNRPENRGVGFQFSLPAPSASGRDDHHQKSEHKTENCQELSERDCGSTRNTSELANYRYDSRDDSGYLQHGFGESSFSAVGYLSSLPNHSGPVPYSGSVSLRSDSSTTSTRSFAFPVLQQECNSSPVRMAKADRRRLRKCRGWREGLLCCRF